MKLYLSSYRVGNEQDKLLQLIPEGKKIGFVPNALDHVEVNDRTKSNTKHIADLAELGVDVEMLDLRNYFGKVQELRAKMNNLGGIWTRGGNTFVLRHAMYRSGMDQVLKGMKGNDFFYGGFSAGCCVLSPTLKYLQHVDDPQINPYDETEPIWEGLGIIDFAFLPHYRSNHPESDEIELEVDYCKQNNISFRTFRDGEVIVMGY